MSFDDSRSARGPSKRADQRGATGPNADRSRSSSSPPLPGADEPANDDGRLPTIRDADRPVAGRTGGAAKESTLAIAHEGGLAEFLTDAYVVTDGEGVIRGVNSAALELFGKRRPALQGVSLADLIAPADRAKFRARLRRLATSDSGAGQASPWVLRLRGGSGKGVEANARACAVRDAAGGISFVRWLLRTTGDDRTATESDPSPSEAIHSVVARQASRYTRIVTEASALLSRSFDLDETLSAVARLALPVLGDHCWVDVLEFDGGISRLHVARRANEGGGDEAALATAPSVDDAANLVVSVLDTGIPVLDESLTQDRLHELAVNEEQFGALRDLRARSLLSVPMIARGRVLGALSFIATEPHRPHRSDDVALAEDLAQRAGLAADNARLYAMAQGASTAKDEFMASMSHELRTPLTAIIGYTELLGDEIVGPLNATQREQLSRIRASGNLLLALVDQVLDLARVDAGKQEPRLAEVSAAAVVDQVVMLSATQVRQKNLALTVKAPPPDVELVTDPLWLRQILVNLLGNAVKFTERGEVGISAVRDGGHVVFEVWDTGIGIPVKHLERIFDPFWQVEQRMTRKYGGAGVGLAVAQRLCTLLGGDISVSSALGAGSRFVVSLPATPER